MAAALQLRRLATLLAAGALLAGCAVTKQVGQAIAPPHEFIASDFCADLMKRAYPEATFDVTDRGAHETSITTVTTTIAAHRTDVTAGPEFSQDVAVECAFDHNVLVGFRWTKGPFRPE